LRSFYAHAVAVLVPSICYEVFPMVVLEALREGVPIICRDLGPFPEIVRKSGGGLLFNSQEDLKESIQRMLQDRAARETMGKLARKSFELLWSERAGMKAYFSLIREIAERRKRGHVLDVLERCDEFGHLQH
jgi:glycosyltransferase involved in cell wall biosynthesis